MGVQASKRVGGTGAGWYSTLEGGVILTLQFSIFLRNFTQCNCPKLMVIYLLQKYQSFGFYLRKVEPRKEKLLKKQTGLSLQSVCVAEGYSEFLY